MSFKMPDDLIRNMTDVFTIERDGQEVASAHGFFCGKEYPSTIQLVENTTVHEGDWLIHAPTKNRYFATEVQPISINGEIFDWMVNINLSLIGRNLRLIKPSPIFTSELFLALPLLEVSKTQRLVLGVLQRR